MANLVFIYGKPTYVHAAGDLVVTYGITQIYTFSDTSGIDVVGEHLRSSVEV
jgi:hypothetical protein